MIEQWRDIKGFEGYYQISSKGEVRSLDRIVNNNGGDRFMNGKIMKPFVNGSGYLQVRLSRNNERLLAYVHKLVAEAFIENPNNFTEVNHIDHDKLNCESCNLEWCTRQENMIKSHYFHGTKHIDRYCECGKILSRSASKCIACLGVSNRKEPSNISKEELETLICTKSFLEIGRMFNVSDNAVRKWCKRYGLPYRKKDLNKKLDKSKK